MTDKLDIFLTEARRNYDISVSTIDSYDKKLGQVFTMCTAIIGILLIGVSLLFTTLQNRNSVLNLNHPFVWVWLMCLVAAFFSGLTSFSFCLKGLKLQEFEVTNPIKLFDKYNQKNENELKEFLIVQIGKMYEKNFVISNNIKNIYRNSLNYLMVSSALTITLFIFTLLILQNLIMVV